MNKILQLAVQLVLPALGILMTVAWILGATAIIDEDSPIEWLPFAAAGIAIALCGRFAPAALVLSFSAILSTVIVPAFRYPDRTWPIYVGVLIVIGVTAASKRTSIRWTSLALASASAVVMVLFYGFNSLTGVLFIGVPTIAVWGIGCVVGLAIHRADENRKRHALEAEVAASEAELAIASERDRIAQDVHDIMAHSLSVIVAQADGARFVQQKQPGAVDESLAAIAESARESLAEVRLLIEGLSSTTEGHSHPSLAEIPALVARMESAGLAVVTTSHGEPSNLTLGQELALYRIVQESLTNALNHAGAHPSVRVSWDWQGPGVALLIASTGDDVGHKQAARAKRQEQQPRVSRGITGMRERARLAGGWLAAEPDADEPRRFVVTAFVPTASDPAAPDIHALATATGAAQ